MDRVILASTSRYRRELMERLGVPFEAIAPDGVDERAVRLAPRETAEVLAAAKAMSVARHHPEAVVIGSDQVASIDGEVLEKPGTLRRAEAQLRRLAGHEHELLTAVCAVRLSTGERLTHLDTHRLTVRRLSDAEIRDYVRRDEPIDCAGSYKIERLGIALMERIAGEDFTAITGLPLVAVTRMLGELGVPVLGGTA